MYCISSLFWAMAFYFREFRRAQTLAKISTVNSSSIYSNDNIRKNAKLTTRELPQGTVAKTRWITVRENNGLYRSCNCVNAWHFVSPSWQDTFMDLPTLKPKKCRDKCSEGNPHNNIVHIIEFPCINISTDRHFCQTARTCGNIILANPET